uniref:Uncharacterized protein n=1 Tax=Arundo donax TaxID=35708 RepID=A0A0A9CJQ1_ARUDO
MNTFKIGVCNPNVATHQIVIIMKNMRRLHLLHLLRLTWFWVPLVNLLQRVRVLPCVIMSRMQRGLSTSCPTRWMI